MSFNFFISSARSAGDEAGAALRFMRGDEKRLKSHFEAPSMNLAASAIRLVNSLAVSRAARRR
ncbi:MAG: hypothetical protein WD969_07025, partial [Paracoccaceae bacterium]